MVVKIVRNNEYDEYRPDQYEEFHEAMPGTLEQRHVTYIDNESDAGIDTDRSAQVVYLILGITEALLAVRMAFLLLGASTASGIVQAVYLLTYPLVRPFAGIFNLPVNEFAARFETATLLAMVMYALLGWVAVQIIRVIKGRRVE